MSTNPAPYSGKLANQSTLAAGIHQQYFYNASVPLQIAAGDILYAYVYLDPSNPPSEVMLQCQSGSTVCCRGPITRWLGGIRWILIANQNRRSGDYGLSLRR